MSFNRCLDNAYRNASKMDVQSTLRLLQTVIGSVGIFGNFVVCIVIAKVPAMRTLTNAFIFNQAVIDFLGSLLMVLDSNIAIPAVLHRNALIAGIQCFIWDSSVILWVIYVASTLNLVMLTSERYLAIVYPFKYLTYFRKTRATAMLVAVWVSAIGYKGTNVIYRQIVDRACVIASLSTAASLAWGIVTFLVEYLIPLIFMTFCYVHIILQLKKASSTVHAEPSTSQQGDNSMSGSLLRARRNTLKTLFIVFATYTICWLPNQVAFFMFNFGFPLNFNGAFYLISVALVQLNCCINPIIYSFKYKQFQTGVRVLLKPCCPKLAHTREGESVAVTLSHR
ncbi:neuromedin-U receptor 2-like [Patiria miniata]|uniref:G-protein coupled receptors family 1 profile domain-containing protein n=1 Tax=Patiria miniata TaxID=46514 RepID=A0A913ZGL5_PATMI|nr:neuromedin-U receptor 2-like [Patiria miniata]